MNSMGVCSHQINSKCITIGLSRISPGNCRIPNKTEKGPHKMEAFNIIVRLLTSQQDCSGRNWLQSILCLDFSGIPIQFVCFL